VGLGGRGVWGRKTTPHHSAATWNDFPWQKAVKHGKMRRIEPRGYETTLTWGHTQSWTEQGGLVKQHEGGSKGGNGGGGGGVLFGYAIVPTHRHGGRGGVGGDCVWWVKKGRIFLGQNPSSPKRSGWGPGEGGKGEGKKTWSEKLSQESVRMW